MNFTIKTSYIKINQTKSLYISVNFCMVRTAIWNRIYVDLYWILHFQYHVYF